MKLFNFKKAISFSLTSLTIFSSVNTLNCAKVSAAPIVDEFQTKSGSKTDDDILFTFADMKKIVTNLESILNSYVKSNRLSFEPSLQAYPISISILFDEFLENRAVINIPNFSNLLKTKTDANQWLESIKIYEKVYQEILESDIDENVKKEIKNICSDDYLIVGNMLNEIRKVMIDKDISQDVKKVKYLITIIDFLKTAKLGYSKRTSAEKLERFTTARDNLMQILESTYELDAIVTMDEAIEDIEQAIETATDPEIKTMAEMILNVVKGRKNLVLAKINVNTANKKEYIEALKNQNVATKILIEAIEKIDTIEEIPQKILIDELKELV